MKPLGWLGIMRLGLVQMALGSIIVLTTATMNRVMVVELALPAILPGLLVALYQGTQMMRPKFGHFADNGATRTRWIIGGMAVLVAGAIGASMSIAVMDGNTALGILLAVGAFILIGFGLGSSATNLLALLAMRVADDRKAAAGSAVWIMMIAGLAVTGIVAGINLDPYSHTRLIGVTAIVGAIAMSLCIFGVWGQERGAVASADTRPSAFRDALAEVWNDPIARSFSIFVFAAMLAYNTQDLILEPYGGHVFGMTPGDSTKLGGMQHAGALMGMLLVLICGTLLRRFIVIPVRVWVVGGCMGSGLLLIALGVGGQTSADWPVTANVFLLGLTNGAFAVAAIGAMMMLATGGDRAKEGTRMGVFGAAQAVAFGLGSFLGTVAVDIMRSFTPDLPLAYGTVFIGEGALFLLSALLAAKIGFSVPERGTVQMVPGE